VVDPASYLKAHHSRGRTRRSAGRAPRNVPDYCTLVAPLLIKCSSFRRGRRRTVRTEAVRAPYLRQYPPRRGV